MNVLFTGCTFDNATIERLKSVDINIIPGQTNYTEEELLECLKINNCECYVNCGDEKCTRNVIENNPQLKSITFMGAGYQQYIDVNAARKHNIEVTYTPEPISNSVAEFTAALILDAVKKITASNAYMKQGVEKRIVNSDLCNKTVGIVGMGKIGKKLARILHNGFGMSIQYTSREEKPDINEEFKTKMLPLNELFKTSDIISVNAALIPGENNKMIGKEQFDAAKDGLIFVNTGRGGLVDWDALYEAILTGKVSCVATDVFHTEPITKQMKDDKFFQLPDDKFIGTPHNAFNSIDAIKEMEMSLIAILVAVKHNKFDLINQDNVVQARII